MKNSIYMKNIMAKLNQSLNSFEYGLCLISIVFGGLYIYFVNDYSQFIVAVSMIFCCFFDFMANRVPRRIEYLLYNGLARIVVSFICIIISMAFLLYINSESWVIIAVVLLGLSISVGINNCKFRNMKKSKTKTVIKDSNYNWFIYGASLMGSLFIDDITRHFDQEFLVLVFSILWIIFFAFSTDGLIYIINYHYLIKVAGCSKGTNIYELKKVIVKCYEGV